MLWKIVLIALFASGILLQTGSADALEYNITEEEQLNFTQRCEQLKLHCEQYDVITEDGFILPIFRVVGDETRPVLLMHGLVDSADTFIIRGVNSLCYALAEAGYDVWVGNSRGNKYTRRHITLDDSDKMFWDFSFHEMAVYDLAATIDFILKETGQKQLSAIGVSQGTTIFYVLTSMKPEYNEKIKFFISMAPIAYLTNLKLMARDTMLLWLSIRPKLTMYGFNAVYLEDASGTRFMRHFCTHGNFGMQICNEILMRFVGEDFDEIEQEFYKELFSFSPTSTSAKDVDHYSQIFQRKRFASFDYGVVMNAVIYGSAIPPDYDLKKVTMPVALLCGANDNLSTLEDVSRLREELPNVVFYKVMDREKFNHIDFIWGKSVNVDVNPLLKELLEIYY